MKDDVNTKMRNRKLTYKDILKKDGAILLRYNKHQIWKLSNNKRFVVSTTSSDVNVEKERLRLLKKLLSN